MAELFDHNISVYNALETAMSNSRAAIIVSATGTGKSFLVTEYVSSHNLKALIICPTHAIMAQWSAISDKLDSISYSKFSNMELVDLDPYDILVFDEAHHAGSPVWGNAFKRVMDNTDKPVIGLTADPVRYSDHFTDVSLSLFGGNTVYGYSTAEAIDAKILPVGEYVCALIDVEKEIQGLKQKNVEDHLISKLQMTLENVGSISGILKKHMPAGWRKGVVFSDDIRSIPEAEALVHEAFPKARVLTVHSGMSRKTVMRTLSEFGRMRAGYLVAVNMLNEGVHIPFVNTVIMLRRTSSPSIYIQQLGRCLVPGNKKIIMFDFVGNHKNLQRMYHGQRGRMGSPNLARRFDLPKQTIIHDYSKDVLDVLSEIERSISNSWTPQEDALLISHYPLEGTRCAYLFPRHSVCGVACRAKALGLHIPPKWTTAMDQILRDYYKTNLLLAQSLLETSGVSKSSIRSRARALGLTSPSSNHVWTSWEDDIIRKYYPVEGRTVAARLNGLPKDVIRRRAKKLGVGCGKYKDKWSEEELRLLRDHLNEGVNAVSALLPGRSVKAILTKSQELGIREPRCRLAYSRKRWSPEEEDLLRQFFPIEGRKVCERFPNRTVAAVKNHAKALGIC